MRNKKTQTSECKHIDMLSNRFKCYAKMCDWALISLHFPFLSNLLQITGTSFTAVNADTITSNQQPFIGTGGAYTYNIYKISVQTISLKGFLISKNLYKIYLQNIIKTITLTCLIMNQTKLCCINKQPVSQTHRELHSLSHCAPDFTRKS